MSEKSPLHSRPDMQHSDTVQRIRCSVLITTRNRREPLARTIDRIKNCIGQEDELIVLDDGSTDGTMEMLQSSSIVHRVLRHDVSSGLIAARNELLAAARGRFAAVLDDDAEFLVSDPLGEIEQAFDRHHDAAALAFPIWWGLEAPVDTNTAAERERPVRSWIGCGHAIRLSAWKQIDGYPSWLIFGSEEQDAAMQLFLRGYAVWYIPSVLVHHRVSNVQRMGTAETWYKYWRSLHAGWSVILRFYPTPPAARVLFASIAYQVQHRILRERSVRRSIWFIRAVLELWINARRVLVERQPLTPAEFVKWQEVDEAVVYWAPKSSA